MSQGVRRVFSQSLCRIGISRRGLLIYEVNRANPVLRGWPPSLAFLAHSVQQPSPSFSACGILKFCWECVQEKGGLHMQQLYFIMWIEQSLAYQSSSFFVLLEHPTTAHIRTMMESLQTKEFKYNCTSGWRSDMRFTALSIHNLRLSKIWTQDGPKTSNKN